MKISDKKTADFDEENEENQESKGNGEIFFFSASFKGKIKFFFFYRHCP